MVSGNLNLSAGAFGVQVRCLAGYEGMAVATECTVSGPYSLSGCNPIVCTDAAAQTGYVISPATNLDLSQGALDHNAVCASGYGPAPVVMACTTTGAPYTLAGCDRVFCARKDCAITQMLKPNATENLPLLGVDVTDTICCDKREGYCSVNRNATGNHTELAVLNGEVTYQVVCGPGYGLIQDSRLLELQRPDVCCERLFCTAAACAVTQKLTEGYELL